MSKVIEKAVVVLIFINFIYVLSGVLNFPMISIDVISIWMLKAKAFWLYEGFPTSFLREIDYSHPQYPVLLPFIFYSVFKLMGNYNEIYVLILYPFIYLAIIIMCFKLLKVLGLNRVWALLFTYIYSMLSPLLAEAGRVHAGRADIVILLINWLILYFSYLFNKKITDKYLLVILFLIFISSQVKLEGVFISFVFLFLPMKPRKKILFYVISWLPTLIWIYITKKLMIKADFFYIIPSFQIFYRRLLVIIAEIAKEMLNYRNWYLFWPLFWLVLLGKKPKNDFIKTLVQPGLVFMTMLFLSSYLFSNLEMRSYVKSSADRVMLQLSPFIFLMFSERVNNIIKKILL